MKIKDTLCTGAVTDRTAITRIQISRLLESAELGDDLISCQIMGNAGIFTVIGEMWGDENGNLYVGDSKVFIDENRYSGNGGASSSVVRVTLI